MKRLNQIDAERVATKNGDYIVTVERLKNDINGNPRYKTVIICLNSGDSNFYNIVYTLTQYGNARQIAEHVINVYESEGGY